MTNNNDVVNLDTDEKMKGRALVILVDARGVTYERQCGGLYCDHREVTGFELIGIAGSLDLSRKISVFLMEDWLNNYGPWPDKDDIFTLKPETIEFYEFLFKGFKIDLDRVSQSTEAWIYGKFRGKEAVLTWENSD